MKLKQIFCKHIYKITKTETLGTLSERTYMSFVDGKLRTLNYKNVAVFKTCLKCGKEIIQKGVREL